MSPERAALIEKLRKLSRMTTGNGASEAEAMMAAGMLAKLMSAHAVQWDELKLRAAAGECAEDEHTIFSEDTARSTGYPDWFDLSGTIAELFSCRHWFNRRNQDLLGLGFAQATRSIVYFGLPEDVAAAIAMTQIVGSAVELESASFATKRPRPAAFRVDSFRQGMVNRLRQRIRELAVAPTDTGHGTGLVLLKSKLVDEAFVGLGLQFGRAAKMQAPKRHDGAAYHAGHGAASAIALRPNAGVQGQAKLARS